MYIFFLFLNFITYNHVYPRTHRLKVKNLVSLSHDILFLCVTTDNDFIISPTFIFKLYNICCCIYGLRFFHLNSYILPKFGCSQLLSTNNLTSFSIWPSPPWRVKIVMACLRTILRGDSLTVG